MNRDDLGAIGIIWDESAARAGRIGGEGRPAARGEKSCQPPNPGKMQKPLAQPPQIWWLAPFLPLRSLFHPAQGLFKLRGSITISSYDLWIDPFR
jgi:hypothetical protein